MARPRPSIIGDRQVHGPLFLLAVVTPILTHALAIVVAMALH